MAREYTAEFKLEAVKLANEQRKVGQPVAKVARDLGSVDKILEKPYKSSNKIEKTNKNLSSFIKSGKNAPKIFNFTKKTLNQMTFFVGSVDKKYEKREKDGSLA